MTYPQNQKYYNNILLHTITSRQMTPFILCKLRRSPFRAMAYHFDIPTYIFYRRSEIFHSRLVRQNGVLHIYCDRSF